MKFFILGSFALLSGCSAFIEPQKRYEVASGLQDWKEPELKVASTRSPSSAPLRLASLEAETARAYIEALAKKIDGEQDFRRVLAAPIDPRAGSVSTGGEAIRREILFSVNRQSYRPADRFLEIRIEIEPTNFEFVDFIAAQTKYETINLSKVDHFQKNTFTLKGNSSVKAPSAAGGPETSLGFDLSNENSLRETYDLNERFESLSVIPGPKEFTVKQEGVRGIDLTGNTVLSVSLKPTATAKVTYEELVDSLKLTDDSGRYLSPDKAKISTHLNYFPTPCALKAKVRMFYTDRVVTRNQEYIDEKKHNVEIVSKNTLLPEVIIVPESEMSPDLYILSIDGDASKVIQIETPVGYKKVNFKNIVDATLFQQWLKQTSASSVGGRKLLLDGKEIIKPNSSIVVGTEKPAKCSYSTPSQTPAAPYKPA